MQISSYQNYYVMFFYTILTIIKTTSSFCSGEVCAHVPHIHTKVGNRCEGSISALVYSLSFQRLKIPFRRSPLKEGNILMGRVWQIWEMSPGLQQVSQLSLHILPSHKRLSRGMTSKMWCMVELPSVLLCSEQDCVRLLYTSGNKGRVLPLMNKLFCSCSCLIFCVCEHRKNTYNPGVNSTCMYLPLLLTCFLLLNHVQT